MVPIFLPEWICSWLFLLKCKILNFYCATFSKLIQFNSKVCSKYFDQEARGYLMNKDSKVENIPFIKYWSSKIPLNLSVIYPTPRPITLQNFEKILNFSVLQFGINNPLHAVRLFCNSQGRIYTSFIRSKCIKRVSHLVYGVILEWKNR